MVVFRSFRTREVAKPNGRNQVCSGFMQADETEVGTIMAPLISKCEEAEYGRFQKGSPFSHRCSVVESRHFLETAIPAACTGTSEAVPPLPTGCSAECAPVFEQFYAECDPGLVLMPPRSENSGRHG
jgi:hypothetical protein